MVRYAAVVFCALAMLFAQFAPSGASNPSSSHTTAAKATTENEVVLHRLSGTVNYQASASGPLLTVGEEQIVSENAYASTQANSVGALVFPDASRLTLAGGSAVQVYGFAKKVVHRRRHKDFVVWEGSTIRLPSTATVFRLDVRQPYDGESTYLVLTRYAKISLRAASALLSDSLTGDIITCVDCGAGDVVATVGGQDYAVGFGETLSIDTHGRVAVGNTAEPVMQNFASTGLSTKPLPTPSPEPKRFRWTPPTFK